MEFTKVRCPKFKIGRRKLNEYELRLLMLNIAEGSKEEFIGCKVTDCMSGESVTINPNGSLSGRLMGLHLMTDWSMKHMKIKNANHSFNN
jgi:hypothetical protein